MQTSPNHASAAFECSRLVDPGSQPYAYYLIVLSVYRKRHRCKTYRHIVLLLLPRPASHIYTVPLDLAKANFGRLQHGNRTGEMSHPGRKTHSIEALHESKIWLLVLLVIAVQILSMGSLA